MEKNGFQESRKSHNRKTITLPDKQIREVRSDVCKGMKERQKRLKINLELFSTLRGRLRRNVSGIRFIGSKIHEIRHLLDVFHSLDLLLERHVL